MNNAASLTGDRGKGSSRSSTTTADCAESESGLAVLVRLGTRPNLHELDLCLFPDGPQPGDVIEVSGSAGSGKSMLILHMVISVLLPKTWKGFNLGGCGGGLIYVDTDLHFSIIQLENMMQRRVKRLVRICKNVMKKGTNVDNSLIANASEVELFFHLDKITIKKDIEQLVVSCLANLSYLKCTDSSQFAMTLLSLDESVSNRTDISLVVVDSISFFYWYDRTFRGDTWLKLEQYYSKLFNVFLSLMKKHKLTLIAGRQSLFQKRSNKELCVGKMFQNTSEEESDECLVEYEYLGKEWSSSVSCRIQITEMSQVELGEYNISEESNSKLIFQHRPNIDLYSKGDTSIDDKTVRQNATKLKTKQFLYSAEVTRPHLKRKMWFTIQEEGLRWMPPRDS